MSEATNMSEDQATANETRKAELEKTAKETNASRSGKGTRVKVGSTRGKNPTPISFENFDESLPDTIPTSLSDFMDVAKVQDEALIVAYLIDGFNAAMYTQASDPVAEFVDPTWPDDFAKAFRGVVKSYATNNGISIEDAVAIIKPVLVMSQKRG